MNTLLNKLFSTTSLAFGGEDVEVRFARPLALWVWVGIIVACFAVSLWSYWRLLGSRSRRIGLGVVRGLSLVILALLISGPELIKQNERVEQDWVVVLADRSASMNVSDATVGGAGGEGGRVTREAQLRAIWEANSQTFSAIARDRNLLVLGFDASAYDLPVTDGKIEFGEPLGSRTRIAQVLDQALRRTAARPVAGIVVMSDGRSSDEPTRGLIRQLEAKRIPVFAVPLGSETSPPDLALTRTDAPAGAFIGDLIPVQVDVDMLGGLGVGGVGGESPGTVTLIDEATGQVLDERAIPALRDSPTADSPMGTRSPRRVTLLAKPSAAGQVTWTVKLNPAGADLTKENNQTTVRIDVSDRPIRVLYFDGYPRWEYRYIKNILVREPSIRSSVLILGGERRYIQDGTHILDALPRSAKDWQDFDVVIIGDMRPQLFSTEQLEQIREGVSQRGMGLLWIGGSGSTPAAWRATALADLLPFTLTAATDSQGLDAYLDPVFITPGEAAPRYGVLQLSPDPQNPWPGELLDSKLGWPLMRWAQRIPTSQLKPTTEVLAYASPASGGSETRTPLVMSMRYGAGRVMYMGTDETWRYRYSRGEVLTERFWIPLIRLMARESLGRGGRPATIAASPRQVQVGQQAQISLRLLDQTLIDQRPSQANVRLTRETTGANGVVARPLEITLTPQREAGDSALDSVVSVFSSTWAALEPGVYLIEPSDPLLSGLGLSTRLEVFAPDDELRFPQTNHAALASLANATGGKVLKADEVKDLPTLLPNREVRILSTPDIETLWDKPIVWAMLLFLFAVEWLGRRLMKLA